MSADEMFQIGKSTNLLLAGARGMVGGRFVLRQLNGFTLISRQPKKPSSQTEAQRRNRQRFRLATEFAKKELMSSDRKAHYNQIAARVGLPNAYTAAVSDYMRNRDIVMQETESKLSRITLLEARRTRTSRQIRPDRNPARSRTVKEQYRTSRLSYRNSTTGAGEKDNRRLFTIFRAPVRYVLAPGSPGSAKQFKNRKISTIPSPLPG